MKKERVVILLCVAVLVVFMGGCGKKEASATQLRNDLSESAQFTDLSNRLNVEITNFEIVKRQTTLEKKVDTVWVEVDIAGDAVKGKVYYKMTYNLYNDGWRLENVAPDETGQWSFTPLTGASEELILSYLPDGAEIVSDGIDLKGGLHWIDYQYVEEYPYCNVTYTRQCTFSFGSKYNNSTSSRGEWGRWNDVELDIFEDWHIEGTWEGSTPYGGTATIIINDFSPGNILYQETTGCFDVRGEYLRTYERWTDWYELFNTDGLLRCDFDSRYSIHMGKHRIHLTGDVSVLNWTTGKVSTLDASKASDVIVVTYDGLTLYLGNSAPYKLTKTD